MQPKEYLFSGRGGADSNSSIREALTTILRATAADAHRALSEIPVRKDPDKPRAKAWRCSCGSHVIPPRTFRALRDARRRKVLSHFATAILLDSFVYLEKERAATEPARKFLSDSHTSRDWLTMALGINDATVQRKSRLFPWFVSGGKPPKQLVLNHERSGAAEPLAAAFNSAFNGKFGELASREPGLGLPGCGLPPNLHSPDSVELDSKLSTERAKKKGGRPRKDDERRRVLELRAQKKSWGEVAILMNKERGQYKSQHAYRMLVYNKKVK
jgi:hypothetical protein